MPTSPFGDVGAGPSNSGSGYIFSDGIPMPIGRTLANGLQFAIVTSVSAYASGYGGTTQVGRIQLGPAQTDAFAVGPASTAQWTGLRALPAFGTQGGTTRVILLGFGRIYFGYRGVGQVSDNAGLVRNGTLGGSYSWLQGAAAPTIAGLMPSADGRALTIAYNGSGDQGDASVSGYLVQRARDVNFTQDVQSVLFPAAVAGTNPVGGLTPGVTYFWRVTARNRVSDFANALGGPWSGVVSARQPDTSSIGRIWNGAAWVATEGRTNGSPGAGWDRYLDARIFTATGWKEIG